MKRRYFSKENFIYRELRHIWRSFFVFHNISSYLYHRFIVKSRVRSFFVTSKATAPQNYSIHYLCSHEDLDMLLWSLASWYMVVPDSGKVYIHEDGTFTEKDRKFINSLLPTAQILDRFSIKEKVLDLLKQYPETYNFRKEDSKYIFGIKLVDPYLISNSSKLLIFDTDILWFKKPKEIFELLSNQVPFFLRGKNKMDYKFEDASELPEQINCANSGVVGFDKRSFHLEALEQFLKRNGRNNHSRVIEQAAYVYVLNQHSEVELLNNQNYQIKGGVIDQTIVKHYTGPRRELFWAEGVRLLNRSLNMRKTS